MTGKVLERRERRTDGGGPLCVWTSRAAGYEEDHPRALLFHVACCRHGRDELGADHRHQWIHVLVDCDVEGANAAAVLLWPRTDRVENHVDTTAVEGDPVNVGGHSGLIVGVDLSRVDALARRIDLPGESLNPGSRAAREEHLRALRGELPRDGGSDRPACTEYEGSLSLEVE